MDRKHKKSHKKKHRRQEDSQDVSLKDDDEECSDVQPEKASASASAFSRQVGDAENDVNGDWTSVKGAKKAI